MAIALCAFVSFYSLEYSVISFILMSYMILLITLLVSLFAKPSKQLPFCKTLSEPEVKALQTYHLYLYKPDASKFTASLVTVLRFAGLAWSAIAIWAGLYWQAGLCAVYFFIAASLVKQLSPWSKMGAKAEKGNRIARKQLYLVDLLQIKMKKYNEERHE